jgi:Na+-transporting methylmalonyl-CoA/oxaloacetate decarboxylase gamma subunit
MSVLNAILTSLIVLVGFVFVVCFSLVKLTWDLSRVSGQESPEVLEVLSKPASGKESAAKVTESYESSRTELSDTQ